MDNSQQEKTMSVGKYYLSKFADGIKKFTQTMCMKSIVNGFISVMPVIIVASIFTLIVALPEMVLSVAYNDKTIINPETLAPMLYMDYLKQFTSFGTFQYWGQNISNWSMGVLGLFTTAAISKNMGAALNEKLPFERRINELTLIFAVISVYLLLSVVEFTVSGDVISGNQWQDYSYYGTPGRAIFVDGLAAQGILPGVLIALTVPWVFYWILKYNLTIRLPKQVPQTISQAFLGIIPLFFVLGIYGSIAFGFNILLGMPVLFYLFKIIQEGLTNNPNLNDSYGLIAIYTTMEGGFWFLGVHPEPVHAIMRATFWFDNTASNAAGASHIFTEPYMYGYGAMGGSGCTLMVPFICLLLARSDQMKIVGKTGSLPIIFQVNEPTLFGVPTILNPLFFFPMIFTGMANDMLFKALADSTNFQAGSLYLPWSTPYFLQTSLGTPAAWQPWVFDLIALVIATGMYLPFVIIQDNIYLKENMNKKGLNAINYKSSNGLDVIKQKLFNVDFETNSEYKKWKADHKAQLKQLITSHTSENEINQWKKQVKVDEITLKNKINNTKIDNMVAFYQARYATKSAKIENKLSHQKDTILMKLADKTKIFDAKLAKKTAKIESFNLTLSVFENAKKQYITKKKNQYDKKIEQNVADNDRTLAKIKEQYRNNPIVLAEKTVEITAWKKPNFNQVEIENGLICRYYNYEINKANKKIKFYEELKQQKINVGISIYKEPQHLIEIKKFKAFIKKELSIVKTVKLYLNQQKFLQAQANILHLELTTKNLSKYEAYLDKKVVLSKLKTTRKNSLPKWKTIKSNNIKALKMGNNPYLNETVVDNEAKVIKTVSTSKMANKKSSYQVLVLCLGAGSSAVLANTINNGLKAASINFVRTSALAWGSHESALNTADLVILSPQMGANAKSMTNLSNELGFKLIVTRGKEYIDLSRDETKAAQLVIETLEI